MQFPNTLFSIVAVALQVAVCDATEVYMMLPLDTITSHHTLKDKDALAAAFDKLQSAGVDGVMSDVWWGLTEQSPKVYSFNATRAIVDMAKERKLKVQLVASFHRCGGNVGDTCSIPIPAFVNELDNMWYRDVFGHEDREYVSLFADNVVVGGRTILQMYSDWFEAFAEVFSAEFGSTIREIQVGMGPAGELRYPGYKFPYWSFCGIGSFQCFDDHALASFRSAAKAAGHAEWTSPPTDVGGYNTQPGDSPFFRDGYKSDYGKFFLDWYFSALKRHGADVLSRAKAVFGDKLFIAGKIAGIHWFYKTAHHAAELTAGYYNTNFRNAYSELAEVFAANGNASVDFTCLEMSDGDHSPECLCGPEELVSQVEQSSLKYHLHFNGENALARYDRTAYEMIEHYRGRLGAFTYLRMTDELLSGDNFVRFREFVGNMHGDVPTIM